jgi:hypothetical protein
MLKFWTVKKGGFGNILYKRLAFFYPMGKFGGFKGIP